MGVLDRITAPADLQNLSDEELDQLAVEIRRFLVKKVSAKGGHLGPNLGVVELTIALHRVFNSPQDPIIFDTGHQSYVHKMLTGRCGDFDSLRTQGGLSGYPARGESEHDVVESSHASASLSYADGMAKAFELRGETGRTVVAVIGDGAMTGGMTWEALNNIAAAKHRPVVIVVNDNGRSYSPTIGGIAERLGALRVQPAYEKSMDQARKLLAERDDLASQAVYSVLRRMKAGIKGLVTPNELFSDLDLKYLGPVDGHDLDATEQALQLAKDFGGTVMVHVVTQKGRGYVHAENDEADQMHATGVIDPVTGKPVSVPAGPSWTDVFADELVAIGAARRDVVAITAAMAGPTGVATFGKRFPERMFDVGIAEQHALTSAAGLALGGLHPVVAIYSTFLNRAFDQLLMDVALLQLPVTVVLDRSGVTGPDGASHNGMWDLSLTGIVPGIRVAAPRDEPTLREELNEAVAHTAGPTVVRFCKGDVSRPIEAVMRTPDGVDVLTGSADGHFGVNPLAAEAADSTTDVLFVAVGSMVPTALAAAHVFAERGLRVAVVDPRWVYPVPESVIDAAKSAALVVTIEDGGVHGGVGAEVQRMLSDAHILTPVRVMGLPQEFLDHGSRGQVLAACGLTRDAVVADLEPSVAVCVHNNKHVES